VSDDPEVVEVLEMGCGDPTFTGPAFELVDAAAATARVCVQTLIGADGYPALDFDLATLDFRTVNAARRTAIYTRLPVHPKCVICRAD
jgi:hypothetical protein